MIKPKRPDCFAFAMDFLGEPEKTEIESYIERLERGKIMEDMYEQSIKIATERLFKMCNENKKWTLEEIEKAFENAQNYVICWEYLKEELLRMKKPVTLEVQNGVLQGKGGL
jgi:hypothetical protein